MRLSKIGSKNTYHKCITELSNWGFFLYCPSHNPLKGSVVKMYDFDTSSRTSSESSNKQVSGQVEVSSINNSNTLKHHKMINIMTDG